MVGDPRHPLDYLLTQTSLQRKVNAMTNEPLDTPATELDPAEALRLLEREQRAFGASIGAAVPAILIAWGIAWTVAFGALWLIDGLAPGFSIPAGVAGVAAGVLIVAAIVLSAILGARGLRGIRSTPATAFTGTVYGASWTIAIVALTAIGLGLVAGGMAPELLWLFYPSAYAFLTGFQYVVAAAIWQAVPSLVMGVWLCAAAAIAPFLGQPGNLLFLAVAGGPPFLAVGIAQLVRTRKADR